MTTEDDFQAALDAQPDAHHLRQVFADWLQERGDPRAEAYRAMGTNRWHPDGRPGYQWTLYHGPASRDPRLPSFAFLPPDWWALIIARSPDTLRGSVGATGFVQGVTRRAIEDAAALAFALLPAARRAELLADAGAE